MKSFHIGNFLALASCFCVSILSGQDEKPKEKFKPPSMLEMLSKQEQVNEEGDRVHNVGIEAKKLFSQYAEGFANRDVDSILSCYASEYSAEEGKWVEELESDRDGIQVYRWAEQNIKQYDRSALKPKIRKILNNRTYSFTKLKLNRMEKVSENGKSATAVATLWLRGEDESKDRLFESKAPLRLEMIKSGDDWKITRQQMLRGVTVFGNGKWFTDVTKEIGIDFEARHNPVLKTKTWKPHKFATIQFHHGGVATADYDNDGWFDLLFSDGKSPRLLRNEQGNFRDVTDEVGLPNEMPGMMVGLMADMNNDGHKDIFFGCLTGANRLFRNDGQGKFIDVTDQAGLGEQGWVQGAACADYNGDGLIDIYVCHYLNAQKDTPSTFYYSRNGTGHQLFRNNGDFTFTDVTQESLTSDTGLGLAATWSDFNGDRRPDLYVVNDFGRNRFFLNYGDGRFRPMARRNGALGFGYGMSASSADMNNDGMFDLYITNIHAGTRWFTNSSTISAYAVRMIKSGTWVDNMKLHREMMALFGDRWTSVGDLTARGNLLLMQNEQNQFIEVDEANDISPFGFFWGSTVFDFDNDGWQDVYTANGFITGEKKDDL